MSIIKRYTNIIGAAGNFEIDSDDDGVADGLYWGDEGDYSIGDDFFTSGLRSQRVSSKTTDTSQFDRFVRAHDVPYVAGKTYFIGVDYYSDGIATPSLYVYLGAGQEFEKVADAGYKKGFMWLIVTADLTQNDGEITMYNKSPAGLETHVDFDGLRMYEITPEEAEIIPTLSSYAIPVMMGYSDNYIEGPDIRSFNTKTPLIGERLYELLPNIYKTMDGQQKPEPFPLKRFFQIAGVGLEYLKEKVDGQFSMYDPLTCPAELLPYLFRLSGFEPPNFLPEDRMRAFLKVLPSLYATKGSRKVFEYLGRTIFGQDSDFIAASREGNNIIIDLTVVLDGAAPDLNTKTDQFRYLAEHFRPVNRSLNVIALLLYFDSYEHVIVEEELQTLLTIMETDETYAHTNLSDPYTYDIMGSTDDDVKVYVLQQYGSDYAYKISGSTAECPNVLKAGVGVSIPGPSGVTFSEVADYTPLYTLDGTSITTTGPVNGSVAQQHYAFDVVTAVARQLGNVPGATTADKAAWCRNNLSNVSVQYSGYGKNASPSGQIHIWNAAGSVYWSSATMPNATIATNNYSVDNSYIGDDGKLYVVMRAGAAASGNPSIVVTDYITLLYSLNTGAKAPDDSTDSMEVAPENEVYAASKGDSYTDVLIQTNVVGRGVIGKMRLGNSNTIIGTYNG